MRLDVKKNHVKIVPGMAEARDHVDRFLEEVADTLPPFDIEVEGIMDRINGLNRRILREMEETLDDFDLTFGEYKVLGSLRRAGPPYRRSPGELAKEAELSTGAMTNRIDRLEEAGLVRRLPDPNDRRAVQVELTAAGKRTREAAFAAQAEKEALVASALGRREQKELNALLRRLMLAFEKREAEQKPKMKR
jgi:DNA-binding MarR family transcriptional regulator